MCEKAVCEWQWSDATDTGRSHENDKMANVEFLDYIYTTYTHMTQNIAYFFESQNNYSKEVPYMWFQTQPICLIPRKKLMIHHIFYLTVILAVKRKTVCYDALGLSYIMAFYYLPIVGNEITKSLTYSHSMLQNKVDSINASPLG